MSSVAILAVTLPIELVGRGEVVTRLRSLSERLDRACSGSGGGPAVALAAEDAADAVADG